MIRVAIASDTRLWREGLADALSRRGVDPAGSAGDLEEALACARSGELDILLVDLAMPGSLDAIRQVALRSPEVRVVALGVREAEEEVVACAEAGVSGYVTRGDALEDLVAAIHSVSRGEMLCSPRLAATLLRRVTTLAATQPGTRAPARLTDRELEIGRLMNEGLSNKEIARRLRIEVPTVKNHVHNILEKTNAQRRAEATARMREHGLLSG